MFVPPPRVEQTPDSPTNTDILETVGQGVGRLAADLGVESLSQVLIERLGPAAVEELSRLLRNSQGGK